MARLDSEAKDAVTQQLNGKAVETVQDAGRVCAENGPGPSSAEASLAQRQKSAEQS